MCVAWARNLYEDQFRDFTFFSNKFHRNSFMASIRSSSKIFLGTSHSTRNSSKNVFLRYSMYTFRISLNVAFWKITMIVWFLKRYVKYSIKYFLKKNFQQDCSSNPFKTSHMNFSRDFAENCFRSSPKDDGSCMKSSCYSSWNFSNLLIHFLRDSNRNSSNDTFTERSLKDSFKNFWRIISKIRSRIVFEMSPSVPTFKFFFTIFCLFSKLCIINSFKEVFNNFNSFFFRNSAKICSRYLSKDFLKL